MMKQRQSQQRIPLPDLSWQPFFILVLLRLGLLSTHAAVDARTTSLNSRNAEIANTVFPDIPPTLDPYYANSYTAVDLGVPPLRIDEDIGALVFKDANTLYLDVNTFQPTAEIEAVTVVRGADQHIIGFSGSAIKVADAPNLDGGLQFGFDGILFYTAFPINQLGQFKPGHSAPDKLIDLAPLGVASSVGSLGFVPPGFAGAGGLKLISWDAKMWYSTSISPDGTGTFNVSPVISATALPNTPWEGMAFILAGQPLFSKDSVLLNADLISAVYAFELDSNGNPKVSTQKHFLDISDPVGMTVDPVTGDILITSEQGPKAKHISLIRGFSPTTALPTPAVTVNEPVYAPGEGITVNFAQASGNSQDWIGLFSSGAANTAYLQWLFTDGTQSGTPGLINGSATFPAGLLAPGNYEARLFFGNTVMQAYVKFVVQGTITPPSVATLKSSYQPGESIDVSFSHASGNSRDWIGLFQNGAANTTYLKWFYTDGTQTGTGGLISGTINFPTGLPDPGTYEARLFFSGSYTLQASSSFTIASTPPGQATNPNPANNATGASLAPTLTWTAGTGAASHQVYFGTNPSPGAEQLKGSQAGTSYSPGSLAGQTTYYWRIDEVNSQSTTPGAVWSFSTASGPTVTTSKASYNSGEAIVVNYSNAPGNAKDWIGLYVSGSANSAYLQWFYTDGTQTGTPGRINGSVTFGNGLSAAGSYEARLFSNDSYGLLASVSCSVQGAPPGQASSPNPAHNATGASLAPTLTWTAGTGTASHQVYFGTNPSPGTGEFKGSQTGTSYSPGALVAQTTYYWRVDEVNGQATTTGLIWSFTTASGPGVSTSKPSYHPGELISANYSSAPGNAHDWIGLFAAGSANTAYLQWFYTDGTQTGNAGHVNGTVAFAAGLSTPGNYEARLFSNNSYTLLASTTFTIQSGPPGQASDPIPAFNSAGVSLNPTLNWSAGASATSHQVYFGTNPNPGTGESKGSQTGTGYSPGTLAAQTTYYWRIDEVNGQGTTIGSIWSFTTGTGAPPALTTSKTSYNRSQAITLNFSNAPGNSKDWIGLYAVAADNTQFLQWLFTDGTKTGTPGLLNGSVTFSGGIATRGNYEARLFSNDSYSLLATASFRVQ